MCSRASPPSSTLLPVFRLSVTTSVCFLGTVSLSSLVVSNVVSCEGMMRPGVSKMPWRIEGSETRTKSSVVPGRWLVVRRPGRFLLALPGRFTLPVPFLAAKWLRHRLRKELLPALAAPTT